MDVYENFCHSRSLLIKMDLNVGALDLHVGNRGTCFFQMGSSNYK